MDCAYVKIEHTRRMESIRAMRAGMFGELVCMREMMWENS